MEDHSNHLPAKPVNKIHRRRDNNNRLSRAQRLNWDLVSKRLDEMEKGNHRGGGGVDSSSAVDNISGDNKKKNRCSMVDVGKKLDRLLVAQHKYNNHAVIKEGSSSSSSSSSSSVVVELCNRDDDDNDDYNKGKEKEIDIFALPMYLKARYIEMGISVEGLNFIDEKDYYDQKKYYNPEISEESLQVVNGQLVYSFKGYEV